MRAIKHSGTQLNMVGPQVRKLRLAKGWTQTQLALKMQLLGWDTSRDSVTRLESQSRRVTDVELYLVARVLGVRADELFPGNLRGKIRELAPGFRAKLSRGQVPPAA